MRFRSLVAVGALTVGLVAGGVGVASAVPAPPAPNTPACTALVNRTSEVSGLRTKLSDDIATAGADHTLLGQLTTATLGTATTTVLDPLASAVTNALGTFPLGSSRAADVALANPVVTKADQQVRTDRADLLAAFNRNSTALCTGTTSPAPTTTTPAPVVGVTLPTGVTAADNAAAFALVNGDIDAITCGNESGQLAKVRTDALSVQGKLTPAQVGQLRTALRAKLANLGCTVKPDPATVVCPNMPAVPATTTTVTPGTTDTTVPSTTTSTPLTLGAVPNASAPVTTSGSQVGTVPSGAVNTGDGSTVR